MNKDIQYRLKKFKEYLESSNDQFALWIAAPTITKLDTSISKLENFGNNYLSRGLNCSADDKDGNMEKYGVALRKHIDFHEKLFKKLTDLPINILYCPKVCNIFGKIIDDKTIIPPTAYRLGYYAHNIKKYANTKNHQVIIEIGAGFGLLCNILRNIFISSTYIIIDIKQTLISIAYILYKWNIPFICCNEINDLDLLLKEKKNIVILLTPKLLEKISTCDVVLAMDCLSEFPKQTIQYYFDNIQKLNPKLFYTDYTNLANGSFVENKIYELQNYKFEINQNTPITVYMHPYISPDYGKNDIMREQLLKINIMDNK